jgi:uncharacterized protein YkuJ
MVVLACPGALSALVAPLVLLEYLESQWSSFTQAYAFERNGDTWLIQYKYSLDHIKFEINIYEH